MFNGLTSSNRCVKYFQGWKSKCGRGGSLCMLYYCFTLPYPWQA